MRELYIQSRLRQGSRAAAAQPTASSVHPQGDGGHKHPASSEKCKIRQEGPPSLTYAHCPFHIYHRVFSDVLFELPSPFAVTLGESPDTCQSPERLAKPHGVWFCVRMLMGF